MKLYSKDYVSGVSASTLSAQRRRTLLDHSLRSEADAAELVRSLELGAARNEADRAMNRPIVRLYGLVVLLFALLIAFTSRWTIFEASLAAQQPAQRARAARAGTDRPRPDPRIQRGRCSRAACAARKAPTERTYPSGSLFAQTVGYSYTDLGADGHRALSQHGAERGNERHEPAGDPRPAAGQAPRRATKS